MIKCPICSGMSPPGSHRCVTCGADFSDPDVRAMAEATAAADIPEESLGEAGALAGDKFLWMSHEKLIAGKLLQKLALIGGVFLAIGFLVPVFVKGEFVMPWKATAHASTLALVFPGVAAIAGIALALLAISNAARAGVMVAIGLAGLTLSVPALGKFAGTSQWSLPVLTIGVIVAGIGAALRIYRPRSDESRYILAAGAAVTVVALFIPIGKTYEAIPMEFWYYIHDDDRWRDLSLFSSYAKGIDHDVLVRFLSMYGLLPLLLFPIATAVAWPKPGGVWDKSSSALRPMAWMIVMYIPFGFALALFNVTGWAESEAGNPWMPGWAMDRFAKLTKAIMLGRAKLMVTSLFYTFWVVFGAVVLYDRLRGSGAHPAAPTDSE